MGLRVVVYDKSEARRNPFLAASWYWAAKYYLARGAFDASVGVESLPEMLRWLVGLDEKLDEIQLWCHGNYGYYILNRKWHDASELRNIPLFDELRHRMWNGSLWWFRTCSTFGGVLGQKFATEWARYFQCRVAGHTYIIGPWQSGLHSLLPGEEPSWSPDEGWYGSPSQVKGKTSFPWEPNTIFCAQTKIPERW